MFHSRFYRNSVSWSFVPTDLFFSLAKASSHLLAFLSSFLLSAEETGSGRLWATPTARSGRKHVKPETKQTFTLSWTVGTAFPSAVDTMRWILFAGLVWFFYSGFPAFASSPTNSCSKSETSACATVVVQTPRPSVVEVCPRRSSLRKNRAAADNSTNTSNISSTSKTRSISFLQSSDNRSQHNSSQAVKSERQSASTPLNISGIFPHLAAFNQPSDLHQRAQHGEAGIGAVVPWAGRLWFLTYPPHQTTGSNDKLYELDADWNLVIRPESVGGTHACRMIHRETEQLIIGPYFIDKERHVRVVDLHQLRGRMTAVFRHLTAPADWVYFYDMEGKLYEVNVHTLQVHKLFEKPVPGWHGKGGYTGQGRIVLANNGELGPVSAYKHLKVGGPAKGDEAGVLAEWNGRTWRIVERKQFCDVTGPGGLYGNSDDEPIWAIGWDRRSVILKLLDHGKWYTYRLPKASYTYDPSHGWYTEWPRIREIAPGHFALCMHGTLFDFPKGFCQQNRAGIRPRCTFLRVIPDFCYWQGLVVLAGDDASMLQNPLCGQSQSNLWFGTLEQLRHWGPPEGWGGPWLDDDVKAGQPSDPFLFAGYRWRCLHLSTPVRRVVRVPRCSERFTVEEVPPELSGTLSLAVRRGDYHQPAPAFSFFVDRDVTVFIAVDDRGEPELDSSWRRTNLKLRWNGHTDSVYFKAFAKGRVEIPGRRQVYQNNAYPLPNLVFVRPKKGAVEQLTLSGLPKHLHPKVTLVSSQTDSAQKSSMVQVTVELDRKGDGQWEAYKKIRLPAEGGYKFEIFPPELQAEWIRLKVDQNGRLSAYFHFWSPRPKTNLALNNVGLKKAAGENASSVASTSSVQTLIRRARTFKNPDQTNAGFHAPSQSSASTGEADARGSKSAEPGCRNATVGLFDGLADADRAFSYVGGVIRPAAHNRSLQWLRSVVDARGRLQEQRRYIEVKLNGREGFWFDKTAPDRSAEVAQVAKVTQDFQVDAASVIVTDYRGRRFRLPKGPSVFDRPFPSGRTRGIREVATERFLANIHGTFYEIPRAGAMATPDFERIKPVCSHCKIITDFCSWRGLLVLSGVKRNALPDGHVFVDADGCGLWFGALDDLWKLGAPVGQGGPWKNSPVQAGVPSDPYLMTGYCKKRLELRHDSRQPVTFSIEVDFDLHGFHLFRKLTVPPGQTVKFQFPPGFQAHWVRLKADHACKATAWFIYE